MRPKSVWVLKLFIAVVLCATSAAHADPVRLQPRAVTASRTYSGSSASNAMDGNPNTMWNAGVAPTGQPYPWIQIDLGRTVAIQTINLLTAQTPACHTTHVITAGQDPNNLKYVGTLAQDSSDNHWLEYPCGQNENCGNVRYIRITTTESKSWVAWREIEIEQNIEYFGYFFDAVVEDHIAETTDAGANLVMIGDGDVSTWPAKLAEATSRGAKVVVSLAALLFDENFTLRYGWEDKWDDVVDFVANAPEGSIAAIYPLDEPYNRGWVVPGRQVMAAQMQQVSDRIHEDTGLPVAVILRFTELGCGPSACPTSMFDWIGFDCYGPWDNCEGQDMDNLISLLKGRLLPTQRMIAVPWAFRYVPPGTTLESQAPVVDVIDRWHKEILSDPGYIVVMPFLWQSGYIDGPNNPPANGTVDLPIVETRLRQFAHSVLSPDSSLYPVDYHASATTSNTLPFYAFDEDASTMWNAGAFPEAWIFADFGGSTRVKSIALKVAQYPAGRTTHVIEGCQLEADDCLLEQGCTCKGGWSTLVSSTAYTRDGGILSWQLNADLSRIRVRTTLSPSWVAWKGIRFSQ